MQCCLKTGRPEFIRKDVRCVNTYMERSINTAVCVVNAALFLWTALRDVRSVLYFLTLSTGANRPAQCLHRAGLIRKAIHPLRM